MKQVAALKAQVKAAEEVSAETEGGRAESTSRESRGGKERAG